MPLKNDWANGDLFTPAAANDMANAVNNLNIVFNAKDYGVLADGSNVATALNTLITTVSTDGGGVVLLPLGVVTVNSSIQMKSNVTLRGQGFCSVIKLGAPLSLTGVININGAVTNATIENLKIDGNTDELVADTLSSGIWGESPGGYTNITVRNVWVDNTSYVGIGFLGSTTRATVTENIRVESCKTSNTGNHGIIAQDGVDRFWAVNNYVSGHGQGGAYEGLGIVAGRSAYDVFIVGNHVNSVGTTLASEHSISLDSVLGRVVCSDNTVVGGEGYGIEIGHVINGTVTGNTVTGGDRTGIMLTGFGAGDDREFATSENVTISSNTVTGTLSNGIGFTLGSTAASQDIPASGTIVRSKAYTAATTTRVYDGRRLYECTTSGTTHASVKPAAWGATELADTITDGTSVWTDRGTTHSKVVITGNMISECSAVGIDINYAHDVTVVGNTVTSCGLSGIKVASDSNMYLISDNIFSGNNTTMASVQANMYFTAYTGVAYVVTIRDNRNTDGGVADYLAIDSATSLRIDDRFPANTTTPTIAFGDTFFTQNSSATSISTLRHANTRDGRVITVRVADDNTSFTHSASGTFTIRLLGGVNFTAPNGTMMAFAWSNSLSQWIEIYRSTGIPAETLALSTTQAVGFGSIELGHASDTTLSRSAAGVLAVEGVVIPTISSTSTLTNKTITSPRINAILDSNGNSMLATSVTASAVNHVQIGNAATGAGVPIQAVGSDNNIILQLWSKGTSAIHLRSTTGGIGFMAVPTASGVNYLTATASAAGAAVALGAAGSDSNININLVPKGTGVATVAGNPLGVRVGVPASAAATGAVGQFSTDASWLYVCTATDTWMRTAIATW